MLYSKNFVKNYMNEKYNGRIYDIEGFSGEAFSTELQNSNYYWVCEDFEVYTEDEYNEALHGDDGFKADFADLYGDKDALCVVLRGAQASNPKYDDAREELQECNNGE